MINVNNLPDYVDQNRLPLITKTILGAKSAQLFNLQTGVKYQAALNLLNTTVAFNDGTKCGWDGTQSDATFSQRTITVAPLKVISAFCDKDLLKKWTGYQVNVAAGNATLPFEEYFTKGIVDQINSKVEKMIWTGKASAVNGSASCEGLIEILKNEPTVIKVNTGATIIEKVENVYKAIPVDILETASIVMSCDMFRRYVLELSHANLYHYDPRVDGEFTVVMPGTSTKVIGVPGLDGADKDYIVATNFKENVFYGCDMEGDEERFDLWYSQDNLEFRLAVAFNVGVQVAYPDNVVVFGIE